MASGTTPVYDYDLKCDHGIPAHVGCNRCGRDSVFPPRPRDQQPHRCPVCEGRTVVPAGFYADGDYSDQRCRTCGGTGVLWR